MRDMLRDGAAWLSMKMRDYAAQEIHYRRGAADITLRATIGDTVFEVSDSEGFMSRVESRDYLVDAADFEIDGIPAEPEPGDRIIEGDLEDGHLYEVAAPAGQPVWQWADRNRTRYRIHTKYVGRFPIT